MVAYMRGESASVIEPIDSAVPPRSSYSEGTTGERAYMIPCGPNVPPTISHANLRYMIAHIPAQMTSRFHFVVRTAFVLYSVSQRLYSGVQQQCSDVIATYRHQMIELVTKPIRDRLTLPFFTRFYVYFTTIERVERGLQVDSG